MSLPKKLLCGIFVLVFVYSAAFAEEFVIHKIRFDGLKRISLGTALSYLADAGVKEGERIDSSQTGYIIRALYKTNFFSDISLTKSSNDLLIKVVERAVIGSIKVSGNSKITTKDMDDALKRSGLVEGQAMDQALLNGIVQALMQQYHNLGLYAAKIDASAKPLERNRVAVTINIKEGPAAKIKSIKITGNTIASERTLLGEFSLATTKLWSFFTNSDQYSQEKLDGDLEKLRSYYMDRGYLHFKVDSVKVAITPDKKHLYITIHVVEGLPYKIKGVSLDGNLIGKRAEILKLITLKTGVTFSRKDIMDIQANINRYLGDYGYGLPDIGVEPIIDDSSRQIFVKFMVNPGQRVYIHRINFKGNTKTHDEVLRREMRLHEGSMFNLSKIEESKRLLANLGYLEDIEYKLDPVSDEAHQMDLTYSVKEASAVSATVQGGYSDAEGFLYGAGVNDSNVLGSGKTASVRFDNSKATQMYSLGYYDPYFTINHIGFNVNAYFQKTDTSKLRGRSPYSTNVVGGLASFVVPLSDLDSITLGAGVEHIKIKTDAGVPPKQVSDFINSYGYIYNQLKAVASWQHSNLNRAIFPTKGFAQSLSLTGYAPLNKHSLEFYKIEHTTTWYQPLFKDFILRTGTDVGYGSGFGRTKALPFFQNFFAGGIGSVRGFEAGDLGGGDEDARDDQGHAKGGNVMTVASAGIIIPTPMKDTVRPSIFIDVGDVYNNRFKIKDLRASCGIQLEWRTPLAPLVFSLAKPIRKKDGDRLEMFQFSISASI
ncbi:Outer membrane protein assembly factor BamA [Gammaproteobacteria bacterium]